MIVYQNDNDRAYGLAGMAISMASLDALDRINGIFLDAEGPMIEFAGAYYYPSSPAVSAKAVWNHLLSNFHLTTSVVVANIMARTIVLGGRMPSAQDLEEVREVVRQEGRDTCSLDEEESDVLFDKVLRHNLSLFENPRLHPVVSQLAEVITRRRRLSVFDLEEELELLRI